MENGRPRRRSSRFSGLEREKDGHVHVSRLLNKVLDQTRR